MILDGKNFALGRPVNVSGSLELTTVDFVIKHGQFFEFAWSGAGGDTKHFDVLGSIQVTSKVYFVCSCVAGGVQSCNLP